MAEVLAPFVVAPEGGTPITTPFSTGSGLIKTNTQNTNGALTIFRLDILPKLGPGVHIHSRDDEIWYVLDGLFRFKAGDSMFEASTGGLVFGPRGMAHAFQNIGDTTGHLLAILTPSGLERFFEEFTKQMPGTVGPEELAAMAHDSGLEFVGPPLAVSDPL